MNKKPDLPNISRKELAQCVARQCGMTYLQVAPVIASLFEVMTDFLSDGRCIQLRTFGVFRPRIRKSRIARNPKKPEQTVMLEPIRVVHFKAGRLLKAACARKTPPT